MRKAAAAPSPARVALATRHRAQLAALPDHVGYQLLQSVEQSFRTEIFSLIESRYIELIFHINMTFAQRRFPASDISEDSDIFLTFVQAWREARQMEINALMDGDAELGALSARHMRNIWQNFIRSRTS
jgi:DNA-binding GntR family transcriptional regulator